MNNIIIINMRDIFHEIVMHTNKYDLINVYLALRPDRHIDYYISQYLVTDEIKGLTVTYMPAKYARRYIIYDGNKCIRIDIYGKIHNIGDKPAIISKHGHLWYKRGKQHRIGGPAGIYKDSEEWCYEGKWHRTDGPAIIYKDGAQQWWYQNMLHRTDGPAVITSEGNEYWFMFGIPNIIDSQSSH